MATNRTEKGELWADSVRFPNQIKSLADYVSTNNNTQSVLPLHQNKEIQNPLPLPLGNGNKAFSAKSVSIHRFIPKDSSLVFMQVGPFIMI